MTVPWLIRLIGYCFASEELFPSFRQRRGVSGHTGDVAIQLGIRSFPAFVS